MRDIVITPNVTNTIEIFDEYICISDNYIYSELIVYAKNINWFNFLSANINPSDNQILNMTTINEYIIMKIDYPRGNVGNHSPAII